MAEEARSVTPDLNLALRTTPKEKWGRDRAIHWVGKCRFTGVQLRSGQHTTTKLLQTIARVLKMSTHRLELKKICCAAYAARSALASSISAAFLLETIFCKRRLRRAARMSQLLALATANLDEGLLLP